MITKDGQCEGGKGELTGREVAEIIRQAQESLLGKITAALAQNTAAAGSARLWGRGGCDGQTMPFSTEDTTGSCLADIAKAMAKSSEVEGTNIDILGKEQKIEEKSGDADKTVDLLGEIP